MEQPMSPRLSTLETLEATPLGQQRPVDSIQGWSTQRRLKSSLWLSEALLVDSIRGRSTQRRLKSSLWLSEALLVDNIRGRSFIVAARHPAGLCDARLMDKILSPAIATQSASIDSLDHPWIIAEMAGIYPG